MLNTQNTQTNSSVYIGVDIGGTNTRKGLFASLEASEFMLMTKFPTDQSYEEQLRRIIGTIQGGDRENLADIGISVAARIARDGRSVIVAPNLPDYIDKPHLLLTHPDILSILMRSYDTDKH